MVRKTHDAAFRLSSYSIPMSRVREERLPVTRTPARIEVDMQVAIGSTGEQWHRPMLDPRGITGTVLKTACGRDIGGEYYKTRQESYLGELCPDCFAPAERAAAAEYSAVVAKRRAEEAAMAEAEREAWFDKHMPQRSEDRRITRERMKALEKPEPKEDE